MKLEAAIRLQSTTVVDASVKDSLKPFVGAFALCAKAYADLTLTGRTGSPLDLPAKRKAREAARKALGVAGATFESDLMESLKAAGFPKVKSTSSKVSKVSMIGWFGAHYGVEVAPKKSVAIYLKFNENAVMGGDPIVTAFVYVNGKSIAKYGSSPAKLYKDLPKVIKPADIMKALSPALVALEKGAYKELK